MPKSTFYNLPKEKQNKVIQAAREEFVRAKDGEILIKNIVISAGIPRGSFYQYFETKEDLVDFLMENHFMKMKKAFLEKLLEFDGDVIVAFEEIFKNMISNQNKEKVDLERKIIENIKRFQERRSISTCPLKDKKLLKEIPIDKEKFKIESEDDLESVVHIIMSILLKNIIDLQNGNSEKNVLKNVKRDLDYVRFGILK